ncbi:MAG TPA: LysR family transcriptional regulator [Candidatus Sulfotelmatobacter sp.]|nr:LysR family transcriptional regulator [Candidatus Sulfotelmatobacter sp.]
MEHRPTILSRRKSDYRNDAAWSGNVTQIMYSLDQLRSFVAVAEELSFRKAAERLSMTQPPLSRQIQKLERDIHVLLFVRDNRSVVLTPAGIAFLQEARRLLAHVESAPEIARRISEGSTGLLRIGFTGGSALQSLGAILNDISDELPGISVDLREMVSSEQIAAIENGDIDLGLARPPVNEELFDAITIHREALVVAVPANHSLTRLNRPIWPDDLKNEAMIMHSPTKARYFYDLVVRSVPAGQKIAYTASQVLTIVALVAARRGLAVVPESTRILGYEGVVYLPFAGGSDPVELQAVWKRASANPALSRVVALLNDRFLA